MWVCSIRLRPTCVILKCSPTVCQYYKTSLKLCSDRVSFQSVSLCHDSVVLLTFILLFSSEGPFYCHDVLSYCLESFYLSLYHFLLYCTVLKCTEPCFTVSFHIVSYYLARCVMLHYIAARHAMSSPEMPSPLADTFINQLINVLTMRNDTRGHENKQKNIMPTYQGTGDSNSCRRQINCKECRRWLVWQL